MNAETRPTRPKRPPMDSMRKTALAAGVLYLITFVTSIPALGLYHDLLKDPAYILGNASDTGVLWGALGEITCALAGIASAVVLFRVTKRQSETAGLGFVMSRTIEAAMIFVGVLSVLSLVTLHQGGADASSLAGARVLVAIHDWTFLLGPGLMPAVNALCLGYVMYRSRLVPRIIPTIGLIGAPLLFAAFIAVLFGWIDQVSGVALLLTLPIAAWEFALGVWLTVKGFNAAALARLTAPTVPELDGGLTTAVA